MAKLIDSSVFITLERRGSPIGALATVTPGRDEFVALAAITASELLTGVERADSQDRRATRQAFVESVLSLMPVLPFDLQAARLHARLWADLAARGLPTGAHDLMIAATAMARGYGILTDNLRDFRNIPGLEVQQPDW